MNRPFVHVSLLWPLQKQYKHVILASGEKHHLLHWTGPVIYSDTLHQWETGKVLVTWD